MWSAAKVHLSQRSSACVVSASSMIRLRYGQPPLPMITSPYCACAANQVGQLVEDVAADEGQQRAHLGQDLVRNRTPRPGTPACSARAPDGSRPDTDAAPLERGTPRRSRRSASPRSATVAHAPRKRRRPSSRTARSSWRCSGTASSCRCPSRQRPGAGTPPQDLPRPRGRPGCTPDAGPALRGIPRPPRFTGPSMALSALHLPTGKHLTEARRAAQRRSGSPPRATASQC
ncbi:hypothetical protein A4R44_05772 [Amycolatopsis sp. M39]|nr:hypothetical protein A4R44_05772 [Amycolatopsis sp. M39]